MFFGPNLPAPFHLDSIVFQRQAEVSAAGEILSMASPVALASEEPLPVPISRLQGGETAQRPLADELLSPERARSLKKQASAHVTPYQALPIQGPLIETRLTPSQPILEPDEVR